MKIDCKTCREELGSYVDATLDPELRGALQTHLDACETCAHEAGLLRETVNALRSLPPAPVRKGFRSELRARLRTEAAVQAVRTSHRRTLAMAASVALVAGLALGLAVAGWLGGAEAAAGGTLADPSMARGALQDGGSEILVPVSGTPRRGSEALPARRSADPASGPLYLGAAETDSVPRDYYLDPTYPAETAQQDDLPAVVYISF